MKDRILAIFDCVTYGGLVDGDLISDLIIVPKIKLHHVEFILVLLELVFIDAVFN